MWEKKGNKKEKTLEESIEDLEELEKTMFAETDTKIQSVSAKISQPERELKESFELAKKKSRA